jgi:hypothetical protein
MFAKRASCFGQTVKVRVARSDELDAKGVAIAKQTAAVITTKDPSREIRRKYPPIC